jgi:hypothetical protein
VGVTLDEWRQDTASSPDNKRKRSNIEKEEVLGLLGSVAGKNGGLDSGTVCNGFIGVDALIALALKKSDTSFTIPRIQVEPPTIMNSTG